MPQTRDCDYCGDDIEPGTGTMFVAVNGSVTHFCSSKCEKNADLGRESRDLEWTETGHGAHEGPAADEQVEPEPEPEPVATEEPSEDPATEAEAATPAPDLESVEAETDEVAEEPVAVSSEDEATDASEASREPDADEDTEE